MLSEDAPIAARDLPFFADPDASNADLVGCSYRRPSDQRRIIVVSNRPEKNKGQGPPPDSLICARPVSPDCTWDHLVGASQARFFRTRQVDEVRQAARESLMDTSLDPSEVPDPVGEGKKAALRFLPSRKDDLGLGKRWTLPPATKEEQERRSERRKQRMEEARSSAFFSDRFNGERGSKRTNSPKQTSTSQTDTPTNKKAGGPRPSENKSGKQASGKQASGKPNEEKENRSPDSRPYGSQKPETFDENEQTQGEPAQSEPAQSEPAQSEATNRRPLAPDRKNESPAEKEAQQDQEEKASNEKARKGTKDPETESPESRKGPKEGTVAAHGSLADELSKEEDASKDKRDGPSQGSFKPDPNQRSLF